MGNKRDYNFNYVIAITLVATLGGLLFGYDTAVISGTVESLRKFFIEPHNLSLDQANALEGFVVSSALIGCIIGASFAGWLSQRYGRRSTLIFAAILFLLSAIGSAWPEIFVGMPGSGDHNFTNIFVIYRIIGGIGVGLASMVSPMYIAEIAPARNRGNLVSWNQFAIIFGMLVVYFVNYTIALQGDATWLHNIGWRWMFASEIIPATLFLLLLFFVPETPRYLAMRNRYDSARSILERLVGKKEAEYEINEIRESLKEKVPSLRSYYKFMITWLILFVVVYLVLRLIGNTSALEISPIVSFFVSLILQIRSLRSYYKFMITWLILYVVVYLVLRLTGNTNALEISLIVSFFVSLILPIRSYGLLIILVGVLLSAFQQLVGINVVLYYAPEIFKTMGAETDAALLQQIIVGVVNLSFTVLAILTVDKFGRKPLMIIGALVMSVSMLVLGTTFYTHSVGMSSLICMLIYTAGFAMSWGPVCWVLLAEIFPNSLRSVVMSIAVAAQWITNFLISWTFPMLDKNKYLTDTFNHGMAYWIYGLMGILAALFVWKMVPETKGKTLEDMNKLWRK
jgi:SP family xylose:H+ symportor-like MFS transporter